MALAEPRIPATTDHPRLLPASPVRRTLATWSQLDTPRNSQFSTTGISVSLVGPPFGCTTRPRALLLTWLGGSYRRRCAADRLGGGVQKVARCRRWVHLQRLRR